MEGSQTGFSSSPPSTTTTTTTNICNNINGSATSTTNNNNSIVVVVEDDQHLNNNNRTSSPAQHHNNVLLKEKAKDELDRVESEAQQQLPSISEVESWRTTTAAAAAYYHHPLVAVIDDPSALYDTYKLPSLAKFGKGLTAFGKLPAAIWSVAVTSPEDTQGIPTATTVVASGGSPTVDGGSPTSLDQQQADRQALTNATTIYLRGLEKERSVIIQQVMPDGSVQLRPLSDLQQDDDDNNKDATSVVPVDELPPLAPASAVEVKREPDHQVANNVVNSGNNHEPSDETDATAQVVTPDMPLQGAYLEGAFEEPNLGTGQYSVLTNVVVTSPPEYAAAAAQAATGLYTLTAATTDYYREYYAQPANEQYAQAVRQHLAAAAAAANTFPQVAQVSGATNGTATLTGDATDGYVERYVTAAGYTRKGTTVNNGQNAAGIAVELPSPDSGIGGEAAAAAVTPRDAATLHQIFDYTEPQTLLTEQDTPIAPSSASTSPTPGSITAGSVTGSRKTSWSGSGSEFGRTPEADKVHIPKLFSDVGFKYYLETPISTSQRRDDDRMTYINKGQYYGLTLEYIPDSDRPLRSGTVKSLVMLVFREEKSPEDELKAWKFWHSRQHSVKQRILDVDTKNSSGVIGQIEEVTHNAIAFYWNPLDGPAKVSISVHCLSTDFSNQKGVKGLPLHLQIDTTDDLRENGGRVHRGYCQIKVFCDKGAERKTRDEERRAAKRKLTATPNSRKKLDEMYHLPCERSEFYSMSDLTKPPVLFMPQDDHENCNGPELTFYAIATVPMDGQSMTGDEVKPSPIEVPPPPPPVPPVAKKIKLSPPDRELTSVSYPWESAVLLYVRRVEEEIFHPLHLVPPTLAGLAKALADKYGISSSMVRHLYKRCKKGITVEMDDDMVRHYCNEDTFLIDLIKTEEGQLDVTLVEL